MVLQYSIAVRNARLDAVESTAGAAPTLQIRTGAPPASAAAADSGTLLCTLTLPSDWMANAASGVKAIAGTWSGPASAAGTAGHFRIKTGATTHIQGTITATGGGGDMIVDNVVFAVDQVFTVTGFTLTAGNA